MSERNITYLTNACLITCIVEMGSAEKVLEAAKNSGAQGATINYARGTGIREKIRITGSYYRRTKRNYKSYSFRGTI